MGMLYQYPVTTYAHQPVVYKQPVGYNTYQTGPLSFVKQPIVAQHSSFYPVTYHTLGKREAEAEAWTVYGGAYGYPYTTYGGYGYRTPYTYSSLNYGNRFYY